MSAPSPHRQTSELHPQIAPRGLAERVAPSRLAKLIMVRKIWAPPGLRTRGVPQTFPLHAAALAPGDQPQRFFTPNCAPVSSGFDGRYELDPTREPTRCARVHRTRSGNRI